MVKSTKLDEELPDPLEQIQELQRKIAELKKSWPAHSVPAHMLQRLENLEEELEALIKKTAGPPNCGA